MRLRTAPLLASVLLCLPAPGQGEEKDRVDFVSAIAPILKTSCIECHGPDEAEGDVRLDSRAALFDKAEFDWVVIPGKPDESRLVDRIVLPADDPDLMPADGEPLGAEQIEAIRRWIEQGADWPPEGDAYLAVPEQAPAEIALPELTAEQIAAEAVAWEVLQERGVLVSRIAADTKAVDVNFSLLRGKVGDDDLLALQGLQPTLLWLDLSHTGVGDAGMAHLRGMVHLRRLHLADTAVGDAGLAELAALRELEYLNLYGTRVTDAGLVHLQKLPRLRKVFLWQTEVSAGGAAALQQKRPELYVDRGDYATTAPAEPVNELCPVSGKAVDPRFSLDHEGLRIGFCCADCRAKFEQDPSAFQTAIQGYRKRVEAAPINELCPVSGKPVDPAHVLQLEGMWIGFCCADCKAKFAADPARYRSRLPPK